MPTKEAGSAGRKARAKVKSKPKRTSQSLVKASSTRRDVVRQSSAIAQSPTPIQQIPVQHPHYPPLAIPPQVYPPSGSICTLPQGPPPYNYLPPARFPHVQWQQQQQQPPLKAASTAQLTRIVTAPVQNTIDDLSHLRQRCMGSMDQGAATVDQLSARFNSVITAIDEGREVVKKPVQTTLNGLNQLKQKSAGRMECGAATMDLVAAKLNSVLTSIDGEIFSGNEDDLGMCRSSWGEGLKC